MGIARESLYGRWVHSHEEDTDTDMVFRPEGFPFPPSRGRLAFELKPDGTLVEDAIAPADGSERVAGTWDLEEADALVMNRAASAEPRRVFRVDSVSSDRLTIRK